MSTVLRPGAGKYDEARCGLADCGELLHIVYKVSQPVYLSFMAGDLAAPATEGGWFTTWRVECEAGHVVLLPPDSGAESFVFGKDCHCDDEDERAADSDCPHGDLIRLRKVIQ